MGQTIVEIVEAFEHLFNAICDPTFTKSLHLDRKSERELAPLVRTFLLGWFGRDGMDAEEWCALPGKDTDEGRVDFVIGGIAVELAVRKRVGGYRSSLSASVNADEMKKLMKWKARSLLVLFDFSNDPLEKAAVENFRDWPSLGQGPHAKHAVNVAYFHRQKGGRTPQVFTLNVRVK